jgi:SAM-dependent methyltransferase
MSDLHSAIEEGHYARNQLFSRAKLIAWSHGRRFHLAVALAREFAAKRVLDYGCGDGTFLALTMMSDCAPILAVGAELSRETVTDCCSRYMSEPRLKFALVADLDRAEHQGKYDAVFCMEVLEHVVDWEPVLARFERLLSPEGTLIISVPVETGLPVLVKQAVRRIAGWQKIGHYPGTTSYSSAEMVRAVFAGSRQHVQRPVFDTGSGPFHDHKGFNWMRLRQRLEQQFTIEAILGSPFTSLGPHLATQAWFRCRLRSAQTVPR